MKCSQGAVELIRQIVQTIELIPEDDYSRPLEVYNGSTLGKHFRHIYDFFSCVTIDSDQNVVDYCQRQRDEQLECDKSCAILQFDLLRQALMNMQENKAITVYADFELENGIRPAVASTLGREIMYAYDHAVHHLAIVKIGIKSIHPDIAINNELGVAASTIRHQHSLGNV